jgi:acyl-CoA synthetase (AMP-forming)/AMP-acid ligase II
MRTNLGSFLAKRAQLSPKLEAVIEVERGRRFSYAELDARANRIAHVLLAKGVRPGDRVAFLLMNGVEYLESYFAVAKVGAVLVPLNWRLVPEELAFILEDSGSVVLIAETPSSTRRSRRFRGALSMFAAGSASVRRDRVRPSPRATRRSAARRPTPHRTSRPATTTSSSSCTPRERPAFPRAPCTRTEAWRPRP